MVIYTWFCSGKSGIWADWDLSLPYINYQLSNFQVKVILQCQQKKLLNMYTNDIMSYNIYSNQENDQTLVRCPGIGNTPTLPPWSLKSSEEISQ